MEIAGHHVRAVRRMLKLLPLELGQITLCELGDTWTCVSWIRIRTSVSIPGPLLLIVLCMLRSVSQYPLLLMFCSCLRFSMNIGSRMSKETAVSHCLLKACVRFEDFRGRWHRMLPLHAVLLWLWLVVMIPTLDTGDDPRQESGVFMLPEQVLQC